MRAPGHLPFLSLSPFRGTRQWDKLHFPMQGYYCYNTASRFEPGPITAESPLSYPPGHGILEVCTMTKVILYKSYCLLEHILKALYKLSSMYIGKRKLTSSENWAQEWERWRWWWSRGRSRRAACAASVSPCRSQTLFPCRSPDRTVNEELCHGILIDVKARGGGGGALDYVAVHTRDQDNAYQGYFLQIMAR